MSPECICEVLTQNLENKRVILCLELTFTHKSLVLNPKHLHLVILQTLLSKATYNWGIHKAINLKEANRQWKWKKNVCKMTKCKYLQ